MSSRYLPYDQRLVTRTREMRQNPTPAEQKLWLGYLRSFPFRVLRQRPIGSFIVDFYCAALKLVIEVDGAAHSSTDAQVYDQERTAFLEAYGLRVIRLTNDEVLHQFETVCDHIINGSRSETLN